MEPVIITLLEHGLSDHGISGIAVPTTMYIALIGRKYFNFPIFTQSKLSYKSCFYISYVIKKFLGIDLITFSLCFSAETKVLL